MDEPASSVLHLEFVIAEMLAHRVLQLPEESNSLHEAGGADRVTTRKQPAGRVDRQFPVKSRVALVNEASAISVFAQAQILISLELARGVRIVQLEHVQVLERVVDASHP